MVINWFSFFNDPFASGWFNENLTNLFAIQMFFNMVIKLIFRLICLEKCFSFLFASNGGQLSDMAIGNYKSGRRKNILLFGKHMCLSTYRFMKPQRWRRDRAFSLQAGGWIELNWTYFIVYTNTKGCGWLWFDQTLGNCCECHGSSEMTIIKSWPVLQCMSH